MALIKLCLKHQAPVQKLDSTIHWIEINFYPVGITIDLFNNWGQKKNPNDGYKIYYFIKLVPCIKQLIHI